MSTRTCEWCSEPLRGRRADAVFCKPACAQAARRARAHAKDDLPPAGAATSGDGIAETMARLRGVLDMLGDGRTGLSPDRARLVDAVLKVLSNTGLLNQWIRAETQVTEELGLLIGRIFVTALMHAGFGPL